MDNGENSDKINITRVSVRNIENRIISARVTGLIKAFVDVLLFFNLHILTGKVGLFIISLPLFCLVLNYLSRPMENDFFI